MAGARERSADRVHERRARALLVSFRQLRHDLASPLSGAALHLEMASRRLAQRADPELAKLGENVRVSQQEVSWASALLELVGDLARSADDALVSFSLAEVVRRGAGRQASRAARDGVRLELPPEAPDATLFGARERLEQAIADVTAHAVARTGKGSSVSWTVAVNADEALAAVAWPSEHEERAERAFVLARKRPGEPPDATFFLARWAVEGVGGTLELRTEGERLRAIARFPREEER